MFRSIIWFIGRSIATLLACWTLQNLIHANGYLIEFHYVVIIAILVIITVRIWMPSCKDKPQSKLDGMS